MALEHILLGMLREPASGYDVKTRFDRVFRHFWAAELSQIYRTLKQLEGDGRLKSRMAASLRGPSRRVYRTTASGRRSLREWLAIPRHDDERLTYLSQVFFLGEFHDPKVSLRFLRQLRRHCALQLRLLKSAEDSWKKQDRGYPDSLGDEDFHAQLTLAFGLKKMAANVEWIDEAITRVARRATRKRQ